jgi:regulator of protease activity HflC (stomatin/prohibitin superfamily)
MSPEIPILEIVGVLAAVYALSSLRIIKQYERGVSFFLGRYWNTKGPGLKFLPTGVAHMHRVSLRVVALDIPPQDVITRDNVSVKVNAVLYMKVKDPALAIIQIENYLYATSQLAQTTLRAVLGQHHLDELLAEREKINETLKEIIDRRTDEWGIEVSAVEVKDVDLPKEMQRAMARQAEAERERRAKIIAAEGEYQASEKLAMAARVIGSEPAAIQLRYLQTVTEIASENNSTTFFPLPMDILRPFMQAATSIAGQAAAQGAGQPTLGATGPRPSLSPPVPEPALPPARERAPAEND